MADQERLDQFILQEIDSVPHLEALLLFWRQRPRPWSARDMAKALYVSEEFGDQILRDLANRSLISTLPDQAGLYRLSVSSPENEKMLETLDRTYRRELIRITRMIHSKTSPALQDFARAFRFKKEDR